MNRKILIRYVISSGLIALFLSACNVPAAQPTSVSVAPTNAPVPTLFAPTATAQPATATKIPPTKTATATTVPPPPTSSGSGRIAFTTDRDGNGEIYVMNPDGSGLTNLTNNPAFDGHPTWSPDGTRIAFHSNRDGIKIADIFVMNVDGSAQTRLTHDGNAINPNWSPDGKRIVFTTVTTDVLGWHGFDISVINADGSGLTHLTDDGTASNHRESPRWLRDSKRIAYLFNADHNLSHADDDLYVMNDDGTGETRVTTNAKVSTFDWSPDATRIAFISERAGKRDLYLMNADGSNQIRLTNYAANIWDPIFSPDSTQIAFTSDDAGNQEIYVINADGSGEMRLTNNDAIEGSAAWQQVAATTVSSNVPTMTVTNTTTQMSKNLPLLTGPRLAFLRSRGRPDYGNSIYIGMADGSSQFHTGPTGDSNQVPIGYNADRPRFSPNGEQLAYSGDCERTCLAIVNIDGTNLREVEGFDTAIDWAPDGCSLLVNYSLKISEITVGGNLLRTISDDQTQRSNPAWTPDGAHLVFSRDDSIYISDAGLKNERLILTDVFLAHFYLSPDGSRLVSELFAENNKREVYIVDLATRRQTKLAGVTSLPVWSPDGHWLAWIGGKDRLGPLSIIKADGSGVRVLASNAGAPAWSPDGTQIAYDTSSQGTVSMIHVVNVDGSGDRTLYQGRLPVWAPIPKKTKC